VAAGSAAPPRPHDVFTAWLYAAALLILACEWWLAAWRE
jgi:hypothetical protein